MPDEHPSHPDQHGWVSVGFTEPNEGCLIGNRAGLELLKEKIDLALQNGEAPLPADLTDLTTIRLIAAPSNPELGKRSKHWHDRFGLLGCAVLLFLAGFVFFAGVVTIFGWWK